MTSHCRPALPGRMMSTGTTSTGAWRRPLTAAVAAAGRGTFTLDGVPRMRERPIQDLVDGLVQLGVSASCTLGTGCPPVTVDARGLPSGLVLADAPSRCLMDELWSHMYVITTPC